MRITAPVLALSFLLSCPLFAQLTIVTNSLPFGGVDQDYNFQLQSSGGLDDTSWSLDSGNLPPGINIDTGGDLFGNPTAGGTYTFTIRLTDPSLNQTTTKKFSIGILQISTQAQLPDANTCANYSQQLQVSDGPAPPYSWSSVDGLPPSGLNLDPKSGLLSGRPTSPGSYFFTVQALNTNTMIYAFKNFSLNVASLCFITSTLPNGDVGSFYRQSLVISGGVSPFAWTLDSGVIPAGITLSPTSGLLSGTPTAVGDYTFTIRVTDHNGDTIAQFFTVHISAALQFSTTSPLPSGIAGAPYSLTFAATGGSTPYTFTSNDPPAGLALSSAGVLSGTPGASQTTFTVTCTDSANVSISGQFSLAIITPGPLLNVSPLSLTFTAPFEGDAPPAQTVQVTPTGTQPQNFQFRIDSGTDDSAAPGWIKVKPATTTITAPASLTVTVNQGQMGASTSSARILIFDANGNESIVMVTLNVVSAAPQIQITPDTLHFAAQSGITTTVSQTVGIRSSGGGGAVGFSTSIQGGSKWIQSVTPSSGRTTPNSTVFLNVVVNAQGLDVGAYHDVLVVSAGDTTVQVPVALFVSSQGAILGLSATGVRFQAQQDGGFSNQQTIQILDLGASGSSLSWQAEFVSGSDLFSIDSTSGNASPSSPGTITITPTAAALRKDPGGYYGLLKISSSGSSNSPLYIVLVLDLASSTALPLPDPSPAGLVFVGTAGKPLAAGQSIAVNTSSANDASFQVSVATADGAKWLSAGPASGSSNGQTAGQVTASVDPTTLAAGIYNGEVDISMSGVLRSVNVTLIVLPANQSSLGIERPHATVSCTPASLAITETTLANNFSVPAGWPAALTVQLNDDCGNPVTNGSVAANFSNADPSLELREGQSGVYSATWQPGTVAQQMTITIQGQAPSLKAAAISLSGATNPNANQPPTLFENGTVNVFNRVPAGALAPGMIIEVYGKGLATTQGNPGVLPLPNAFQGTTLLVGPYQAPLYFISDGQLDVQVAGELTANQQYPVIASLNGAISVPVMADIAAIQLGVAANADGTAIAQHGADSSYVTSSHPAKPGEVLVIYLSGMGATKPAVQSGQPAPASEPYARVTVQPKVALDGQSCSVQFAGLTPGLVGLYQINFVVPNNASNGNLTLQITQNGIAANTTRIAVAK